MARDAITAALYKDSGLRQLSRVARAMCRQPAANSGPARRGDAATTSLTSCEKNEIARRSSVLEARETLEKSGYRVGGKGLAHDQRAQLFVPTRNTSSSWIGSVTRSPSSRRTRGRHWRACWTHSGVRCARRLEHGFRSCASGCLGALGWSWAPPASASPGGAALATLPRLAQARARGKLSYSKVRALTRVGAPDTEERLLAVGMAGTPTCRAHRRALAQGRPAG